MYRQSMLNALLFLIAPCISSSALGEGSNSPKILFTYKDKQYSIEYLTGISDKDIATVLEDKSPTYDLRSCPRPEGFWFFPGLSPWKTTTEATRHAYYQHQCQGLLEYFVESEVFNLFKQRYPVDVKRYYRTGLLQEAISRRAELQDRFDSVILSALTEKNTEADVIEHVKREFPMSNWTDRDWARSLNGRSGFKRYRPYYAFRRRCFPWMVGEKPVRWVEYYCYSTLIRYHIQAEIERDKPKYIRMVEDRFGTSNYFMIRKAQDSDKEQLLKLINLVTNKKGEIAGGGLGKINKTLQELNSPTRMELRYGDKTSIAHFHKVPEDQIKSRQFISLGKDANGMESYLYIFQEEPTPSSKEYSSVPGKSFLYSTAQRSLLRPLVEEVLAAIKPTTGVTVRSLDQIINATGGRMVFSDKMFGVSLPKVVLVDR